MDNFVETFDHLSLISKADSISHLKSRPDLLMDMVANQCAQRPHNPAIVMNGKTVTYGQLDNRASRLAWQLKRAGISRDVVVGLLSRRSIALVVGALGILKAGGAYLPMDPSHPPTRAEFELNDALAAALVTEDCLQDQWSSRTWPVLSLDADGNSKSPEQVPSQFTHDEMQGSDLAYVIYTSGSTGQPKGVEVTHAGLHNLVDWHVRSYSVTCDDRAVLQASPAFDASGWELWPYLAAGASVHIVDDETRSSPERFRDWLVEHRITIAFAPTYMAEKLMRMQWPNTSALRYLLTGADTLHSYPPEDLPFALVNHYGPTECTVVTTSGIVPPAKDNSSLPSIGKPISQADVYVLDDDLKPASTGEIYIGGAGVARGYRNRADLSKERFVPSPLNPKATLFKTGDRATVLRNGEIAFLGRSDDQVKIRGYRIELEEVAAVIERHPDVRGSVVAAQEDTGGEKHLVAYLELVKSSELTSGTIRQFLSTLLPEYMIPGVFCRIDNLPLSTSGKKDRKSLPAPSSSIMLPDQQYEGAQTPVEQIVAAMLAKLLDVSQIGRIDNFFLLGGNSLLGAQTIARIRDSFGVDLTLLTLFNNPTIAELSAEIEKMLMAKVQDMSEQEAEHTLQESVMRKIA